jgi:hypothetical protein
MFFIATNLSVVSIEELRQINSMKSVQQKAIAVLVFVLAIFVGFGQGCKELEKIGGKSNQKDSGNGGGYGGLVLIPNVSSDDEPINIRADRFYLSYKEDAFCPSPNQVVAPIATTIRAYLFFNYVLDQYFYSSTACANQVAIPLNDIDWISFNSHIYLYQNKLFRFYKNVPVLPENVYRLAAYCTATTIHAASGLDRGYTIEIYGNDNRSRVVLRKGTVVAGVNEIAATLPFYVKHTVTTNLITYEDEDFLLKINRGAGEPKTATLQFTLDNKIIKTDASCWF